MTALELAMAIMVGLALASCLLPILLRGEDPIRGARVALAVLAALLFQAHILIDGPDPAHWPLYAAGFVTLLAAAGLWFRASRHATGPKDRGPSD